MSFLIIDVGTSSMRGFLFKRNGEKIAGCQEKYEPVKYSDGRIEQSPETWTESLVRICRKISSESGKHKNSINAVVVTAQRSSVIPVDYTGKPLMDAIMWQDSRNTEICKELETKNDLVFRKSGAVINTVFSGSRMMWIERNCPELSEKIYKYLNVPEYLIHIMTGKYGTDVTYGSRTHLMNIREREWDTELLSVFGIRKEQLCKLHEAGDVLGTVTLSFSAETGIPEGIPVISAGGDQQCAAIGLGAVHEGEISLVLGTGGFLMAPSEQVPENLNKHMICNCSSVKGQYITEANVLTCCSAFDWYCNNFYNRETGKTDYEYINQELEGLDGYVSGAIVLPYFQGRSTPKWNPMARAVFGGITLNTDRRELLKALLEAIFMEIQNNICSFNAYSNITKAYISGGLSKSDVMNQLQADIYGIDLFHMEDSEASATGALMVALVSLGEESAYDTAFEHICGSRNVDCYHPRMKLHKEYEQKRKRMNYMYQSLYDDQEKCRGEI
ncbi:MAG: hypothetical protein LUF35_08210 [Lachnospiraceae bacterium]|nr:hypothetical protein [Lachnospiraceae bacterium]